MEGLRPGPSIPEKQIEKLEVEAAWLRSKAAVPKYFGIRLRFRGRQFFQGEWVGKWGGFRQWTSNEEHR